MMKFNSGDRIVNRATGKTVTYWNAISSRSFIATNGTLYFFDDFEKPSEAIVAVIQNGKPRPSSKPYVHADRVSAETEARRLSELHPGNDFAVYERVSVSSAPKPIATTRAA